jgi:hypothetical protein
MVRARIARAFIWRYDFVRSFACGATADYRRHINKRPVAAVAFFRSLAHGQALVHALRAGQNQLRYACGISSLAHYVRSLRYSSANLFLLGSSGQS